MIVLLRKCCVCGKRIQIKIDEHTGRILSNHKFIPMKKGDIPGEDKGKWKCAECVKKEKEGN